MANQDEIEFECPRCLHRMRVPGNLAGQRTDCSNCQRSLLVPTRNTTDDLFDDIFDSQPELPDAEGDPVPQPPVQVSNAGAPSEDSTDHVESDSPSNEDLLEGMVAFQETPDDQANPLEGDNPFEVDPDAPLKVDGIGDVFSHADVYGFKCDVCDTRVHVRPDQAGSYVECPECFTKLLVKPPEKPKPAQRWLKENRGHNQRSTDEPEEELKLSDPIERPKLEIDPTFGLEPPDQDLLAPKLQPPPTTNDDPTPPANNANAAPPGNVPTSQPARKTRQATQPDSASQPAGKSRRQRYEEAQQRQQAKETGTPYRQPDDASVSESRFPDYEFGSLFNAALEMLKSPGLLWRVGVAVGLMLFGAVAMEVIFPASTPAAADGEKAELTQRLLQWAGWALFGGVPYLFGTLMLWLVSGYIFRDAALGRRQVKSWKNAGVSEFSGTFLIFAFGFFIGGLPALFLIWLVMPLRVLLGPLFLISAWYSQSPFSIVNVDAFKNVSAEFGNWQKFYFFMLFLAFLGFLGGILFGIRAFETLPLPVSVFITIPAVCLFATVTLLFASVCGWHCGRVSEGLENSD